jgi:C4-dicarboxylate-binding protein DctP
MEDIVLFNPAWWKSLPEKYRDVITGAFKEVVPALRTHKTKAIESALEVIRKSKIKVRIASAEEREALREKMYSKTRAAYIEMAGDAGKELISVYEKAYSELK